MPSIAATSPASLAAPPPLDPRRSVAWAVAIASIAILSAQVELFLAQFANPFESYLGLAIVPLVALALVWLGSRIEGRPIRDMGFQLRGPLSSTVMFAAVLVFLFLALRLDPGYIFGFGKVPLLPPILFGYFLLTAPIAAVGGVGLFFGYVLRTLARCIRLPFAFLASAGFFAAYSTSGTAVFLLKGAFLVEYLFTTTAGSFVFGLVLALYVYRSGWNLVGPVFVAAALSASLSLLPIGVQFPSWEVSFASLMVSYGALLGVVGVGLREPRLQSLRYLGTRIGPRRYRFRDRARDRKALQSTLVGAVAAGVLVLSISFSLPAAFGTQTPFLAIATGSMTPTLERGTFVVVEHVAASAIHVGTIIAFNVGCLPSPTVHRVIRIVSAGPNWVYQTKGDANPVQDPCTVPYSHVLGAVVFHVPYLGYLILDPIFAASVVALLVVAPLAWRGWRR